MLTAQRILEERRSVVQEQRRESDKTAIAILQFQIDELDRDLDRYLAASRLAQEAVRP